MRDPLRVDRYHGPSGGARASWTAGGGDWRILGTPFDNLFYQMAALLLLAAALGAIGLRLRQPLVVMFIAVGILVGPAALGWVQPGDPVALLGKLGVSLLLFVVGLRLDLGLVRNLGPVALAAGLGQVAVTGVLGLIVALGLGLAPLPALYAASALTFSSTIIVVKLLSDRREIDALHGRIALGVLIVQDVVVILVMILLSSYAAAVQHGDVATAMLLTAAKGLSFVALIGLLMRRVLPALLHRLADSRELLVLFAIAWAIALAAIGEYLGLTMEVGAFLAGVALASTHYRAAIGARLVSLRDFLLLFFFVELGSGLHLHELGVQLAPAIALSLFVLVGKPLILMAIMGAMGYRKRTAFLTGIALAQISEFSLILAALGVSLGQIGAGERALITLVGLITIGSSSYLVHYSHRLYGWLAPVLGIMERRVPHREQEIGDGRPVRQQIDVILFGLGRYGNQIAAELRARNLRVYGVDFDPQTVNAWRARGWPAHYGDAEDPEFAAALPLEGTGWVVSSIPDPQINLSLLHGVRHHGYRGRIAMTAHHPWQAETLRGAGADVVLQPFRDAAREAADSLSLPETP